MGDQRELVFPDGCGDERVVNGPTGEPVAREVRRATPVRSREISSWRPLGWPAGVRSRPREVSWREYRAVPAVTPVDRAEDARW
jgi:hypothetical protein